MVKKKRAENGFRTRNLGLGKPTLYQLSYFRVIFCVPKVEQFFLTAKFFYDFLRELKIFYSVPFWCDNHIHRRFAYEPFKNHVLS